MSSSFAWSPKFSTTASKNQKLSGSEKAHAEILEYFILNEKNDQAKYSKIVKIMQAIDDLCAVDKALIDSIKNLNENEKIIDEKFYNPNFSQDTANELKKILRDELNKIKQLKASDDEFINTLSEIIKKHQR